MESYVCIANCRTFILIVILLNARGPRNNNNNQYKYNPLTDLGVATMDAEQVEVIQGTKSWSEVT